MKTNEAVESVGEESILAILQEYEDWLVSRRLSCSVPAAPREEFPKMSEVWRAFLETGDSLRAHIELLARVESRSKTRPGRFTFLDIEMHRHLWSTLEKATQNQAFAKVGSSPCELVHLAEPRV